MRVYLTPVSFYQITTYRLRVLGELYNTQPEFRQQYTSIHRALPSFMREAIEIYWGTLEKA